MAQTIQVKRSTGSAAPATIAQGELAYSKGSQTFYIGDPAAANTPIAIGPAIINNAGTASLVTGVTGAEIRTLIGAGTGQVDAITAGTGLVGSGTTTVTLDLDFTELTDMVAGVAGTTEMIINNAGVESRKALSEIDLGVFNNDQGWTSNTGTLTSIIAGSLIDVSGATDVTINVDLSELVDMTAAVDGALDEMVLLDSGVQRRKLLSEIDLSAFNNDAGWTSNTGTVTDQPAIIDTAGTPTLNAGITAAEVRSLVGLDTGNSPQFTNLTLTGNLDVTGSINSTSTTELLVEDTSIYLNSTYAGSAPSLNASLEVERGTVTNSALRWNETSNVWELDNGGEWTYVSPTELRFNAHLGAVAPTDDGVISVNRGSSTNARIFWNETADAWQIDNGTGTGSNIVTSATQGGVSSVTEGDAIDVTGTAADPVIHLDLEELTDMTAAALGADELVILDNSVAAGSRGRQHRKAISEIPLSIFNNDLTLTTNLDSLTDVTITAVANDEILQYTGAGWENQTLAEAGIQAVGGSVAWGTITGTPTTLAGYGITDAATSAQGALADSAMQTVTINSTDGSITGTGTSSGTTPIFDLEVGTIDGGTY